MMIKQKLNLGCGRDIKKDSINVDFEKFEGVDKLHDLNKMPYPFKKNQFSEIIMKNILEHLDDPYKVMKEIHRISKPNARIYIRVPHFSSIHAWADLQHKRGYSISAFSNDNLKQLFKVIKQKIEIARPKFFLKSVIKHAPLFYEKYLAYIFTATDLVIELSVKK